MPRARVFTVLAIAIVLLFSSGAESAKAKKGKKAPPPPKKKPPTPPKPSASDPKFDNVMAVLTAYNLTSIIAAINMTAQDPANGSAEAMKNGTSAMTLFAVTNEAYADAMTSYPPGLFYNLKLVEALVAYHGGPYAGPISEAPASFTTFLGIAVTKSMDLAITNVNGTYYVKGASNIVPGAKVIKANIKAGNSYVHILDGLLKPDIGALLGR